MTETPHLALPLVQPSQAQKHVTVNEALSRLDAAVQLSVVSRGNTAPPMLASEGERHIVATGGVNAWTGRDGHVALWQNGGWVFLSPQAGWRAHVADEAQSVQFDGTEWLDNPVAVSAGGAAFSTRIIEFDHVVDAGPVSVTPPVIPSGAVVFGVTGRVVAPVTGSLSSWRLGVAGSDDRYGGGIGVGAGSWLRGVTGAPVAYYAPTTLMLSAEGGVFSGGTVRLALHVLTLGLPR
jgi:hypothetical protein